MDKSRRYTFPRSLQSFLASHSKELPTMFCTQGLDAWSVLNDGRCPTDRGSHQSKAVSSDPAGNRCWTLLSKSAVGRLAGRPQVEDYFLAGDTFVENMSRSSFHLPSA